MTSKNIAVFISGTGSNFKSLIDNMDSINGQIVLCVSNREAKGLKHAKDNNIEYLISQDYGEILESLEEFKVDLIVLAGYTKIIPESIIKNYPNKIINIHPSLIPSFSGIGYFGSNVHKAAIQRGVKLSGATTHFVNEIPDDGPIIIQETVKVDFQDDVESLASKVLEVEHKILPESVRLFCNDQLEVVDNKVVIK